VVSVDGRRLDDHKFPEKLQQVTSASRPIHLGFEMPPKFAAFVEVGETCAVASSAKLHALDGASVRSDTPSYNLSTTTLTDPIIQVLSSENVSLDFGEDTPRTRLQMRTAASSVSDLKAYIDSICQVRNILPPSHVLTLPPSLRLQIAT
jgi:hypothetical protein